MKALFSLLCMPLLVFSQSDLEKVIRGGEIILSGLSILKVARSDSDKKSGKIESLCVKNRLLQKITFRIAGKDQLDNVISRELIVQKESKECIYELPKGIYTYEILLADEESYRKGEYKFDDSTTFIVKDP